MPVFIKLDQRTPEWHKWRNEGITATDSPVIAGISPYNSAWHLFGEKLGTLEPRPVNEFAVRRGVLNESTALELWNQKHDEFALPACIEWKQDRKWRASLDGLTADGDVVEIKCFGNEHLKEVDEKGLDAPFLQYCLVQVHHQIMVADAKRAFFVLYDPNYEGKIREFLIERDEDKIKEIRERGEAFWKALKEGKNPYAPDAYEPSSEEDRGQWNALVGEYLSISAEIKALDEKREALDKRLEEVKVKFRRLMPEDQAVADYGGILVRHQFSRGAIDYKKVYLSETPKELRKSDAELEAYRRKPVEKWVFSVKDNPETATAA